MQHIVKKEDKRDNAWFVDQYNRNRLPSDWVKNYKELKKLMASLNKRDGSK